MFLKNIDKNINKRYLWLLLIFIPWAYSPVMANEESMLLGELEACKEITLDRERLFCFDEAVNTPLSTTSPTPINSPSYPSIAVYPKEWLEAYEMEKKRSENIVGFLSTEKSLEHYETLYFTQKVEDLGIVVFSCINNISRVEVMLETPLQTGIIPVVITGRTQEERQWLLDDTGYILREGRGLPAIALMRSLIGLSQFTLTIEDRYYTLPLEQFDQQVKELQTLCHWR